MLVGIAQGANQPAFEQRPVRQAGQAVVTGLVGQGFVFALQVSLPGFQFIKQCVEVIGQVIQFGDGCWWHASVQGSFTTGRVGHLGQAAQRPGDRPQLPPRQVKRHPGTHRRAQNDPRQTAEQKAQQAAAMPRQHDATDVLPLMNDRQADGLFQECLGNVHFQF
ncbi:hypothetical protein D3C78_1436760 [compost metagenome]